MRTVYCADCKILITGTAQRYILERRFDGVVRVCWKCLQAKESRVKDEFERLVPHVLNKGKGPK